LSLMLGGSLNSSKAFWAFSTLLLPITFLGLMTGEMPSKYPSESLFANTFQFIDAKKGCSLISYAPLKPSLVIGFLPMSLEIRSRASNPIDLGNSIAPLWIF
jgi:hypothetical protein